MKASLLAAGKGTRLKPYTDKIPKCMIAIHGVPLLQVWIELFEHHGVTEVLINTHHHAAIVEQFVSEYQSRTTVAMKTVFEPQLLGSAGTVWQNRHWVNSEQEFIIAYADNLTNADLTEMVRYHQNMIDMENMLTMGLIQAPDPTQCGIVTLDNENRIIRFVEKPLEPESDLANGGIYIANRGIFDYFPKQKQDNGEVFDLGHHLLPCLVKKMHGFVIKGYLKDIGNPDAYHQALDEWPHK